jgi:mono/diheme cytochrome c family protein
MPGMPPTPRTQSPAISGGTLLLLSDGKTAVAADPDRDVLWLADLAKLEQTGRIDLQSGDEPGRLVEDAAGKVHVALRRGGALLTIDPIAGKLIARRAVCAAPRGVAYDPARDRLHVACAGGELVTLAASGGAPLRTVKLDNDLRDVIVQGDGLLVSRFRSAELLTVDASGAVTGRVKPKTVGGNTGGPMGPASAEAAVAWQLHPLADGKVAMLFQRGTTGMVDTTRPGGYANGMCKGGGIVAGALTILGGSGEAQPGPTLPMVAYAVDFAVAKDGSEVSVVSPSSSANQPSSVFTLTRAELTPGGPCDLAPRFVPLPKAGLVNDTVAVAYDGSKRLVTQTRNPARLLVGGSVISFKDAADVANAGHALFHTPTQASMACASCHPEGGDDGRVWNFTQIGARRTQNLRGGLLSTAPFHWDGDMTDLHKLMSTVFVGRMGGKEPTADELLAITTWLDAQPTVPKAAPADPQAVARGKQLFSDATVGCATCHSGAHFTNNATVAVGTGSALQVPSLLDVAMRAPYMHSGCASSLAARFDVACGGGDSHGKTAQLGPDQLADLVSYLQTL